jgi:demethylmenaquinone methyltransferase/2-methoxy-6-polyprenyl-1,4-benzoquinol methylase
MNHPLQTYYSRIYNSYDLVNRLFTFGLDKKWRGETVKECLAARPSKILDLCCGTGDIALLLCENDHSETLITGYDLNPEMLEMGRKKASDRNLPVEFIRGDAASMPFTNETFDCITIGFGFRNLTWENQARDKHIHEINRVLKPGGKVFILESARPQNKVIGFFYSLYLKSVLVPLGGILSGNWNAYRYLAGSSAGFYRFSELKEILKQFGFNLALRKKFLFGSVNLLIATKF